MRIYSKEFAELSVVPRFPYSHTQSLACSYFRVCKRSPSWSELWGEAVCFQHSKFSKESISIWIVCGFFFLSFKTEETQSDEHRIEIRIYEQIFSVTLKLSPAFSSVKTFASWPAKKNSTVPPAPYVECFCFLFYCFVTSETCLPAPCFSQQSLCLSQLLPELWSSSWLIL